MLRYLLTELRLKFGGYFGWSVGLFLAALSFAAMYDQIAGDEAIRAQFESIDLEAIAIYQAFGVDNQFIASLKNFLATYIDSMFIPLLGAFAIIAGSGTLVGEEDAGTLEMTMTLPLPRWQIVLAKAIVLGLSVFFVCLAVGLGFAVGAQLIGAEEPFEDLLMAGINLWPISMVFASIAFFLGAYFPNRRPVWILTTILLVASLLIANLAGFVPSLEPIAPFSPFYYFRNGLTEQILARENLTLLITIDVLILLAILAFQRRNITVGAWPWQRNRLPNIS